MVAVSDTLLQTCAEAGNYELAKDLIMAHDADVDYKDRSMHLRCASMRVLAADIAHCCAHAVVAHLPGVVAMAEPFCVYRGWDCV